MAARLCSHSVPGCRGLTSSEELRYRDSAQRGRSGPRSLCSVPAAPRSSERDAAPAAPPASAAFPRTGSCSEERGSQNTAVSGDRGALAPGKVSQQRCPVINVASAGKWEQNTAAHPTLDAKRDINCSVWETLYLEWSKPRRRRHLTPLNTL